MISFAEVGRELEPSVKRLPYAQPTRDGEVILGNIPILDVHYGNVWTNIPRSLLMTLKPKVLEEFMVTIRHGEEIIYAQSIPFVNTFGQVELGQPVIYINDLLNVAFALNQADFAAAHGVSSGPDWNVTLSRP